MIGPVLIDSEVVRVMSMQYSCRHIKHLIEEKERIELAPDFQRRQVWSNKQRSELIESILLGIPIPVIYLFENQFGIWQVLDGQQRLSAIIDFMDGRYRLSHLSILKEISDCGYYDLSSKLQGKIDDFILRFYVIQPPTSENVKYEIMRRVNKGGTTLNNQEMREMLYRGRITDMLDELRLTSDFVKASHDLNSRRKKDSCLVLRCVAFSLWLRQEREGVIDGIKILSNYKGDVNEMLARSMAYINQRASEIVVERCRMTFLKAMHNGLEIGGPNAFFFEQGSYERKPALNMPLFETLAAIYADKAAISKPDKVRVIVHELKTDKSYAYLFKGNKVDSRFVLMDRLSVVNSILYKLHHD